MLKLPLNGSKAREAIDLEFLATLGDKAQRAKLPGFREAVRSARAYMADAVGIKSVNVHCLRANGELWLIRVTPRTWAKVWNFGVL